MRFLCLFLPLFLASFGAFAFSQGTFPAAVSGNRTTFGSGSIGGGNLGSSAITFGSNGTILATGPVTFGNAAGVAVNGQLAAGVSKAAAAKAIANAAYKAIPAVAAGYAIYDLAREVNAIFRVSPLGKPEYVDDSPNRFCDESKVGSSTPPSQTCQANGSTFSRFMFIRQGTTNTCNVTYSCANGQVFSYGTVPVKVVTDTFVLTQQQLEDRIADKSGWPSSSRLADAFKDALKTGEVVVATPQALTGPATSPGTKTSTTTGSGTSATTTTNTTTNNYNYTGPTVTVTSTSVSQVTNNLNQPVGSPTVTITEPETKPPAEKVITCGLPDTPACKIDETGTKPEIASDEYSKQLDALRDKNAADLEKVGGKGDKSLFDAFTELFKVPALVACEGYVLPNNMGTINPCGVVDGSRVMMGYIWALLGFYWCLGMVREVL